MGKLRSIYNRFFGHNEGVELIASRLRDGEASVTAYNTVTDKAIWFTGSGRLIGGYGNRKIYDIKYRTIEYSTRNGIYVASDLAPLSKSEFLVNQLYNLDDPSSVDLLNPLVKHDIVEVITLLKKVAARLKPGQRYSFDRVAITQDLFCPEGIRVHTLDKGTMIIPELLIDHPWIITPRDLKADFDRSRVNVHDEKKLKRIHRNDTDIKRWFEVVEVDKVESPHTFAFTHRQTAGAPVKYYLLKIMLDSKGLAKRPFYVTEIVTKAVRELNELYPEGTYSLKLNMDTITLKHEDSPEVPLKVYLDQQAKYPGRVDTHPVVYFEELVVTDYLGPYSVSVDYVIETKASYERAKAKELVKHTCCKETKPEHRGVW